MGQSVLQNNVQPARKEILLVGCGAVGAIYALILTRSGLARVTAVARSNFELANSDGIHFKSDKYGNIHGWRPDRLCKTVAEAADKAYDYVIVATKAVPDVITTPAILSPLLDSCYPYSQPIYVLIQNGLNVEVDLYRALEHLGKGKPRIVSTAVFVAANLLEPNVVKHGAFDRLTMGWYRHNIYIPIKNTPEEDTWINELATIVQRGGGLVDVVQEIQRQKFRKNFWNIAFSSWSTLTSYAVTSIYRPPPTKSTGSYAPYLHPQTSNLVERHTYPAIEATLKELVALGRALGFEDNEDGLPLNICEDIIAKTRSIHEKPESSLKLSMLLDTEKGYPIEVEVIFGEVVRMAADKNVPVPRIETLYGLLLVIQNQMLRKIQDPVPMSQRFT